MKITFFDLGKSDCILIEINGKIIMIDTSFTENGDYICELLQDKGISCINYLILTHMDRDHIGGASEIIKRIPVEIIIQPDYKVNTPQYKAYQETLKEMKKEPILLHHNMTIYIKPAIFTLLAPKKQHYKKSNDYSIITKLQYLGCCFLFTGDAESERLKEFIKENNTIYDVVKIPHHGIPNEYLKPLLISTKPTYAVITCAYLQTPIHSTIKLLDKFNVITYLTRRGEVIIKDDKHLGSLIITQSD
ncbi:ComEC/Rec2 family competence protein [Anaerovorax odorimutans]|uniref:ComEC/Rec2 family competence protein n=1 Tax=Anaerovorax odorimutans TaxID=109327 RepID=UPI00040AA867|nr:MBL fold metallo-hydrolase [Anaerovorax odorimutans]